MRKIFTSLFVVLMATVAVAQKDLEKTLSGYVNPEELVSLSETIPFDKAVEVLSKISEKLTGKRIVSTAGISAPIGIEIDKMPYKKALLIIVQYQNLQYEERENVIVIKRKFDPNEGLSEDVYAPVETREVKISAVFFEANITEMREHGINWEFLLSKDGLSLGSNLKTFLVGKQTDDGTSRKILPIFNLIPKVSSILVTLREMLLQPLNSGRRMIWVKS